MDGTLRFSVGKLRAGKLDSPSAVTTTHELRQQLNELNKLITGVFDQFDQVTPYIMDAVLQPTFVKTQRACPVFSGRLRASGYLEITETKAGYARVELGYAKGGDPPYAIFVHERVDIAHAFPTTAKFVQGPVLEDIPEIYKRLKAWYAGYISGGAL